MPPQPLDVLHLEARPLEACERRADVVELGAGKHMAQIRLGLGAQRAVVAGFGADKPSLPDVIPGGSPRNPMGPRALLLDRDEYAIHGANRPKSIGAYASYGCIRMRKVDIVDLYERVRVGAKVVVVP